MTLRETLLGFAIGALLGGCSSPTPSTSSSTHWVSCETTSDCKGVRNVSACTAGYCIDSAGSRVVQSVSVQKTCDPLAEQDMPVQLGQVLAIGTDPNTGTTYLIDSLELPDSDDAPDGVREPAGTVGPTTRVFTSDGDTLVRHVLDGISEPQMVGDAEVHEVGYYSETDKFGDSLSPIAPTADSSLEFEVVDGKTTRIVLDDVKGALFKNVPVTQGTELVVNDPSFVSSFQLKDLPGIVSLDALLNVDDGSVLAITRHYEDSSIFVLRIFWGQPNDVRERQFVSRNNEDIVFVADPATGARVTFHGGDSMTLQGPGFDRAITGGFTYPDIRDVSEAMLKGLTFTCL